MIQHSITFENITNNAQEDLRKCTRRLEDHQNVLNLAPHLEDHQNALEVKIKTTNHHHPWNPLFLKYLNLKKKIGHFILAQVIQNHYVSYSFKKENASLDNVSTENKLLQNQMDQLSKQVNQFTSLNMTTLG